jgi:hypothetical protein
MKILNRLPIIQFTFYSLLLFSCQYSQGVKKDLATGLTASYNGFSIDDIYLSDAEGTRVNNNKFPMGSKVFVTATGVEFFKVNNGRVYPGCTIVLTDKTGNKILNLPDAFADMTNGFTVNEAKTLQASVNTGNPMVAGETYHLSVLFFDKHKKENKIVANVDLQMTE